MRAVTTAALSLVQSKATSESGIALPRESRAVACTVSTTATRRIVSRTGAKPTARASCRTVIVAVSAWLLFAATTRVWPFRWAVMRPVVSTVATAGTVEVQVSSVAGTELPLASLASAATLVVSARLRIRRLRWVSCTLATTCRTVSVR